MGKQVVTLEQLKRRLWTWTTIPFFPKPHEAAMIVIAELLEPLPLLDTHVEQLKRAMLLHDDNWPGYKTMVRIAREICGLNAPPEWRPPYEKPDDLCPRCDSWGHQIVSGVYVRCECRNGQELDQHFFDQLNARVGGRGGLQSITLTQSERKRLQ